MSCKQKLEQIDALLNVDEPLKSIVVLAEMGEDERKDILESLKIVASIADRLSMLGYDGDIVECAEQFIRDVEDWEEEE